MREAGPKAAHEVARLGTSKDLAQQGLDADKRQQLRLDRAYQHFDEGLMHEAKRDLLIAARIGGTDRRATMQVLGARIAVQEGNKEEAVTLLYEAWNFEGTEQSPELTETIVLSLEQIAPEPGSLAWQWALLVIADIGPRLKRSSEACRQAALRVVGGFLKTLHTPDVVPALATTIGRLFDKEKDDFASLQRDISGCIARLSNIDSPMPLQSGIAVAALLPLMIGNTVEFDCHWQVGARGALASPAFRENIEALEMSKRQRLARFARYVIQAVKEPLKPAEAAMSHERAQNGGSLQRSCFNHGSSVGMRDQGRFGVMLNVMERLVRVLDEDGNMRDLKDLGRSDKYLLGSGASGNYSKVLATLSSMKAGKDLAPPVRT